MLVSLNHRLADQAPTVRYTAASLGPTLARVPLGFLLLVAIPRWPLLATIALAAFVLGDVFDGVLARRQGEDQPVRVLADGVIDRITSCSCLIVGAVSSGNRVAAVAVGVIVGRELAVGWSNLQMLTRLRIVFKATRVHKMTSLGYALLGASLLWKWNAGPIAIAAGTLSLSLTGSYIRQQRRTLALA